MAKLQLTTEQAAAVENRGGSLLVSAAAGSGKTKVLVERLFRYITEEHCHVDDFLMITYTRAAAAELRGKMIEELQKRLGENPNDRHLQSQLYRIYQADIKTVDAFCAALLREQITLLQQEGKQGLTADFRVLDENAAHILRGKVLERVLERFYETLDNREGAKCLADTFGAGRDDRKLGNLVLNLEAKLQSHAEPERWLLQQQQFWRTQQSDTGDTRYEALLLQRMAERSRFWADILQHTPEELEETREKYKTVLLETAQDLRAFAEACERGWSAATEKTVVFPRLPAVKAGLADREKELVKARWDACKESQKAEKTILQTAVEELRADMAKTAPAMLALLELTQEFQQAYATEKLRRNVVDFADQEHLAIRLLTNSEGTLSDWGKVLAKRYREILVDEFQDTNEVQNRIFDLISHGGKRLFTVGDVKQSIYRFRLADPSIFLQRYRDYPSYESAVEGEGRKILLSRNFRSRKEILDAVNFVFANVMSQEAGELQYGAEEALYHGASYYLPREDCRVEYHYIQLPRQEEEEKIGRADAEAAFVAKRIAELLESGFPVQEGERFRPARAEDIVILMRSPNPRIPAFRQALAEYGISCVAEQGEDFFSCMEVATIFSLLEIVDNPRQDIPLIAVLRSPLFGFTPDDLAKIRAKAPQGDFYTALTQWDDPKGQRFLEGLHTLRETAVDMGVARLLWHIYHQYHVLGIFGAMGGGTQRRENLLTFTQLAEQFENGTSRGVFDFVTHLRDLIESGKTPQSHSATSSAGVRIMSIHKSKGLEFPIVILADISKRFNMDDMKEQVLVHPKLGLGPLRVDLDLGIAYDTVARSALKEQLTAEHLAEELRILYVALTRPKEKLILVDCRGGSVNFLKEKMALLSRPVLPEVVKACDSLGEWILLPLLSRAESRPLWDLAGMEQREGLQDEMAWEVYLHEGEILETVKRQVQEEETVEQELHLTQMPDFVYPYAKAVTLPAKLTATQLKGRWKDEEIAEHTVLPPRLRSLQLPLFLQEERTIDGATRGTATHLLMQYLDFACQTAEDLETEIDSLCRQGRLTQEQAAVLPRGRILRFLQSELCERIRRSSRMEREYRFSVLQPAEQYAEGLPEGDMVLLQGVVDCFFQTDDGIAVLDFKTDGVNQETLSERVETYRGQIEGYSRALESLLEQPVTEKILYFFATGTAVFL